MLNRVIVVLVAALLWSGTVWTAQGPIQSPGAMARINPGAMPVDHQLNMLRTQLSQIQTQLADARREIADLRARYHRHGHTYSAPGNFSGLNADTLVPKGSLYHGKGFVLLGGRGIPGNQGPLYRMNGVKTSTPVE